MNTSAEAIKQLEESLTAARRASEIIENLIAPHDYQDVAFLTTNSAIKMLEAAMLLMQKDDETAFDALEDAEDLLDEVYGIIDEDTDET